MNTTQSDDRRQTSADSGRLPEGADGMWLDRLGTRLRIAKARNSIPPNSRVLDIGCGDGALFRHLDGIIRNGVGVDPEIGEHGRSRFRYVRGYFPVELDEAEPFDVVVALATLEHVPNEQMPGFAAGCYRHLRPGGRVVLTVPSPMVDLILRIERRLHLAVAPGLHQHHGFKPWHTRALFEAAGFVMVLHQRFQLGLNNLFVFVKP